MGFFQKYLFTKKVEKKLNVYGKKSRREKNKKANTLSNSCNHFKFKIEKL